VTARAPLERPSGSGWQEKFSLRLRGETFHPPGEPAALAQQLKAEADQFGLAADVSRVIPSAAVVWSVGR
jgi:hypothetical protein